MVGQKSGDRRGPLWLADGGLTGETSARTFVGRAAASVIAAMTSPSCDGDFTRSDQRHPAQRAGTALLDEFSLARSRSVSWWS